MGSLDPHLRQAVHRALPAGRLTFLDFNVDRDFGNCVDGLVVVDIHQLKPAKRQRYIEDSLLAAV